MQNKPAMSHPDLLVGVATSDDAGVYRLDSSRALVQTVDFFTPIVDEPYDWGRIAAANALSDVYAMGGTPLTALQLVCWPREALSFELLSEVLEGGADILAEANCTIVGGHSIDDREPKYGFAVTGLIDPDHIVTNAGAAAGDLLVLTKPLGTGVAATAIKADRASKELRDEAVELMAYLNRGAADAMRVAQVRGATDVTGFGLLGHLRELMAASGTTAMLDTRSIPVMEGIHELIGAGIFPSGSARNVASVLPDVDIGGIDEITLKVLADAQTSGGLLISVDQGQVDTLLAALDGQSPCAVVIGEVAAAGHRQMVLR